MTPAEWTELRDRALAPLNVSELRTNETDIEEFLAGATLLRFAGELAMPDASPKPQQLLVVDALACGHKLNAVLLPRRSSKTTTLIAVALGRAQARDDYRVAILTMTTGKAGRRRFAMDVVPHLERIGTRISEDRRDWPFKIVKSAGQERVEFKTSGGSVSWLSSVDDLRGESFNLVILDEAGEAEPDKVADVLGAALPTTDTRPGAQMVVAGTAGRYRKGNLLWDFLEEGRAGHYGIVEYAMPDDTPAEAFTDWETTAPLVLAAHPGVGTLTTLESIEGNFRAQSAEAFAREYGGIFGTIGVHVGLLDYEKWLAGGQDTDLPAVPEKFSMAVTAHVNMKSAAIVMAWRDDEGRVCIHLHKHAPGVNWVADEAYRLSQKYKTPIVYDTGGGVMRQEIEYLERQTPRPRFEHATWQDVQAAAALLVKEVRQGNVIHWNDPRTNEAARIVVKRGTAASNAWAFGRPANDLDADITIIEAASLALRAYDNTKAKQPFIAIVAY